MHASYLQFFLVLLFLRGTFVFVFAAALVLLFFMCLCVVGKQTNRFVNWTYRPPNFLPYINGCLCGWVDGWGDAVV